MNRTARVVVSAIVTLLAATTAVAASTEDHVYAIARDLMCPVCAGQTVAESNSTLAVQMRQVIRERLQQGQTREEIIAYFVAQFGEHVLATPPGRGGGLLLWLAPPAALCVGLAVLRRFVRQPHGGSPPAPPHPTPQEAEHIARELRKMD